MEPVHEKPLRPRDALFLIPVVLLVILTVLAAEYWPTVIDNASIPLRSFN